MLRFSSKLCEDLCLETLRVFQMGDGLLPSFKTLLRTQHSANLFNKRQQCSYAASACYFHNPSFTLEDTFSIYIISFLDYRYEKWELQFIPCPKTYASNMIHTSMTFNLTSGVSFRTPQKRMLFRTVLFRSE